MTSQFSLSRGFCRTSQGVHVCTRECLFAPRNACLREGPLKILWRQNFRFISVYQNHSLLAIVLCENTVVAHSFNLSLFSNSGNLHILDALDKTSGEERAKMLSLISALQDTPSDAYINNSYVSSPTSPVVSPPQSPDIVIEHMNAKSVNQLKTSNDFATVNKTEIKNQLDKENMMKLLAANVYDPDNDEENTAKETVLNVVRLITLHKKLRISSVKVTKFTVSFGFGHRYWRNFRWKTSFFVRLFLCRFWLVFRNG